MHGTTLKYLALITCISREMASKGPVCASRVLNPARGSKFQALVNTFSLALLDLSKRARLIKTPRHAVVE